MERKGLPFEWSDAWVLLSLIYAQAPAAREHLRLVGDSINHAIIRPLRLSVTGTEAPGLQVVGMFGPT